MKVHVVTTAFANANVFRAGMAYLRGTVDFEKLDVQHHVLNNHYPLKADEVYKAIWQYGDLPRSHIHDAGKNLGLHEGLNYLLSKFEYDDDDLIIGYDADEAPTRQGWVEAMMRVIQADPTAGWLSLMAPPLVEELYKQRVLVEDVGGERVQFPPFSLMNCVVGWRGSMLKAVGPMIEPHAMYGGLEGAMQPKVTAAGYRVGFMTDWPTANHRGLADNTYERYKLRHCGHTQPIFPGTFAEWLGVGLVNV